MDLAISEAKLFYVAADHLMAVPVNSGAAFEAGVPKPPFTVPPMYKGWHSCEVGADGQRFLVTTSGDGEKRWPLTVVLNWQAGLKKVCAEGACAEGVEFGVWWEYDPSLRKLDVLLVRKLRRSRARTAAKRNP